MPTDDLQASNDRGKVDKLLAWDGLHIVFMTKMRVLATGLSAAVPTNTRELASSRANLLVLHDSFEGLAKGQIEEVRVMLKDCLIKVIKVYKLETKKILPKMTTLSIQELLMRDF